MSGIVNGNIVRGVRAMIERNGGEALDWYHSIDMPTEPLRLAMSRAKAARIEFVKALDDLKEALLHELTGETK